MELLCSYPDLPLNVAEKAYLCLFGCKSFLSQMLSRHYNEKFDVKDGLHYYKYQGCMIVTCSTDNKNIQEKQSHLAYLASLFSVVFYALDPRNLMLSTSMSKSLESCPLSKLYINTFAEYKGIEKKYGLTEIPFESKNECYLDSSFYTYVDKNKFNFENFQVLYTAFIKSLNIFNTRIQKFNDHEKIIEFCIQIEDLGIHGVKVADVRECVENSEKEIISAINNAKNLLYENIVNYLFSSGENKGGTALVKNEVSYMIIKKKSILELIEELKNFIFKCKNIEYELILGFFREKVYDFLINNRIRNDLNNVLKNLIDKFDKSIDEKIRESEMNLFNKIKNFREFAKEYEINIVHTEYREENPVRMETHYSFNYSKQVAVIQTFLSSDTFILLSQTCLNPTYYPLLECKKLSKQATTLFEFETPPILATGSSASSVVVVLNKEKKIIKLTPDTTTEYSDCYQDNSLLQEPSYSEKFNTLLFISDKSELWTYSLWKRALIHVPMSDQVKSVKICNNDLLILVDFSNYLKVFTFKFEEIIRIDSENSISFIKSIDCNNFSIYSHNKEKSKIIKFKSSKITKPVQIDYCTISEDVAFTICTPTSTRLTFYMYSEDQNILNAALDFYDELKDTYKKITIKPFEDLKVSEITQKVLSNLMKNNYELIANLGNSNLTPIWKSPKVLEILAESNIDFFNKIFELTTFNNIEDLLITAGSVKVLSLIGSPNFFNQINLVFKKNPQGTYLENIWGCINKYKKEYVLCLYSSWGHNHIETMKTINFFYTISDIFIIAPQNNEEFVSTCLQISKNRFPDLTPNEKRVDIWYMNREPSSLLSSYNISLFTDENMQSELEYLLNSFIFPVKLEAKSLIRLMKGVITSLFLDDDVEVDTRIRKLKVDVELHKTILEYGDDIVIESFQLNKNKNSTRCKSVCPGCSAMCCLPNSHNQEGTSHKTRAHRKIKNKFAFTKELKIESTCDLYCVGYNKHFHDEPCVLVCSGKYQNGDWKHHDQGKKFDIGKIEYSYDKVSCSTWWTYKNWSFY